MDKNITIKPFFLSGKKGKLFAISYSPRSVLPEKESILYFPPFAEEMNKTRHMAALQSRKMAESGHRVLMLDLFGTGDSEGDLSEVSWKGWRDDTLEGLRWLANKGGENVIFWGVRLGCLLAMDILEYIEAEKVSRLVFWQPVLDGNMYMRQFLRLRMAAGLIENNNSPSTKESISELLTGKEVEVAGYRLSPRLYDEVTNLGFSSYTGKSLPKIDWFDVTSDLSRPVNKAIEKVLANMDWENKLDLFRVQGEQFWVTPEITILPELIAKTTKIIHQDDCKI